MKIDQKALPAVSETTKRSIDPSRDVDPEATAVGWVATNVAAAVFAAGGGVAAGWAAYGITYVAGYAALSAGLAYAQQALAGDQPSHGSGPNQSSPTYGFGDVGASFAPLGEPLSIVYGEEWPQLKRIQEFTRKINGTTYGYALFAVAQGPITSFEEIQIEGQPIENYDDVRVWTQLGEDNEDGIQGFDDNVTQTSSSGRRIDTSETVVTTSNEPDRLTVGLVFPQGLYELDGGDRKKQTVEVGIELENRMTGETINLEEGESFSGQPANVTIERTDDGRWKHTFRYGEFLPAHLSGTNKLLVDGTEKAGNVNFYDFDVDFGLGSQFFSRTIIKDDADGEELSISPSQTGFVFQDGEYKKRVTEYSGEGTVNITAYDNRTRIRARSTSTVRREFDRTLPESWRGDNVDVKISREKPESNETTIGDTLELNFIREREFADNDYDGVAMLAVKVKADGQLSGRIPSVEAKIKGRPALDSNPDSDLEGWTNNPWYCMYDALVGPRSDGLAGYDQSEVDWDSFKRAAQFSNDTVDDAQGGTEKRHTLNFVIDQKMLIQRMMDTVSTVGQGYIIWDTKGMHVVLDEPNLEPVMVFSQQNIIGNVTYSYKPAKKNYKAVEVQFRDEENDYENTTIEVPRDESIPIDERYPKQSLNLPGVTRRSQAYRTGRLMQRIDKEERLTMNFEAPQEAVHVQPGDLCYIADEVAGDGYGENNGRIRGYGNDYVLLDQQVDISGSDIDLIIRLQDGRVVEERVEEFGGTSDVVRLVRDFNEIGSEPIEESPYSIGTVDQVSELVRVMKIEHKQNGNLELSCVEHSESKFVGLDNFSLDEQEIDASVSTDNSLPVQDLRAVSRATFDNSGNFDSEVEVTWRPPVIDNAARYDIWIDYDASTTGGGRRQQFEKIKEVNELSTVISNDLRSKERVRILVQTVSERGNKLPLGFCPIETVSIRGLDGRPPDVEAIEIRQRDQKLVLDWANVDSPLHDHYEIREGPSWESGQVVRERRIESRLEINDVVNRSYTYHVKSISSDGKPSANAATASINVNGIDIADFILDADEAPDWNGTLDGFAIVSRSEGDSIAPVHDQRWSDIWDSGETWSDQYNSGEAWGLGFVSKAVYTTQTKDIGRVRETNIDLDVALFADIAKLKWSDAYNSGQVWSDAFESGETGTWLDLGENALGLTIEYRISDDNTNWSDWTELKPQKKEFRYIQFRVTIEPNQLDDEIYIHQMLSLLNIRDVILQIESFQIQSGGTTLDYSNYDDQTGEPGFFLNPPKVAQLQAVGNNQSIAFEITNKTNQDMDLIAYDTTDGTSVSATADVELRGI